MSYCRFSDGDVYVYHCAGLNKLTCCSCQLGYDPFTTSRAAMIEHLRAHEAAGHDTGDAVARLEEEIADIGDIVTDVLGMNA